VVQGSLDRPGQGGGHRPGHRTGHHPGHRTPPAHALSGPLSFHDRGGPTLDTLDTR